MLGIFFGLFAGMAGLVGLAGRSEAEPLGNATQADLPQNITESDSETNVITLANTHLTSSAGTRSSQDSARETEVRDAQPAPEKTFDASLKVSLPEAPVQAVQTAANGIEAADLGGTYSGTAIAGRVKTFDLQDDNIESLKMLNGPAYGNVTVNPDNTLALVLSGTTDTADIRFDVQVTYKDGTVQDETVQIDVTEGGQAGGWGMGDFYMLETDEDDTVVVEHGENHRKVYVTGDDDALTLADIAALEGMDPEKVNGAFLAEHPEYGSTPDMALAEDAGRALWKSITGERVAPNSNWLLLERGYDYSEMDTLIERGTTGESELHPVYVGAYGEGDAPTVSSTVKILRDGNENIVFQGIELTGGVDALRGSNLLFDDLSVSGSPLNIQNIESFTLRNSDVVDVVQDAPKQGNEFWEPGLDRESGIFVANTHGVLIEDVLFDHNGWGEGYSYDRDGDAPQAPSKFSHNVYLQFNNTDVTFRDNIVLQGAGTGAQIRSGGYIEDNVFADNNGQVMFATGKDDDGNENTGNYTLFADNVATSGAHKDTDFGTGALTKGVTNKSNLASLVDNIVTHLADPNNPQELADKPITHDALLLESEPFYNDTIIHNWVGSKGDLPQDANNLNTDGLDYAVLNQTTIQTFTAQLLGQQTATISDLADYLRAQADGRLDDVVDADLIIDFFQTGFGLQADLRTEADTLRFVPNDLGDGIRWDNRLNWSTEDLPGVTEGDQVDLAGNWVQYGGTTTIADLDFGEGGKLNVTQGRLTIEDHIAVGEAGATLSIDKAGQLWADGYTDKDMLTIEADGGRFANTGLFTGTAQMTVTDNAQVLLAADGGDYVMGADSGLEIVGSDTRVGFDGDQGNTGVLLMGEGADLKFTADHEGSLGRIAEFFSGRFDDTMDIQSGVNLGDATLHLDLSNMGNDAYTGTLIEVDALIGTFDDLQITGLGNDRDASVIVDYDADTVTLNLSKAGTGRGGETLYTTGDESSARASEELWAALTNGHGIYPEDPIESIPEDPDLVSIDI